MTMLIMTETESYKYLGDLITDDGKNTKNLESRQNVVQMKTITISCLAEVEVLRGIETSVLLNFHEKQNISALLTNAESWTLNRGEKKHLERIEVQALKYLFDLLAHTPTPAIIFSLGTLYTSFVYLHRLLKRNDNQWTKKALHILIDMNIGWEKSIIEALNKNELPTEFSHIQSFTERQWTTIVKQKIETKNRKRLYNDCHKMVNGNPTPK